MSDEFDNFLDSIIKTHKSSSLKDREDIDNYRRNGGVINKYGVISPSPSSYSEASQSSSLQVLETRSPRLLFSSHTIIIFTDANELIKMR